MEPPHPEVLVLDKFIESLITPRLTFLYEEEKDGEVKPLGLMQPLAKKDLEGTLYFYRNDSLVNKCDLFGEKITFTFQSDPSSNPQTEVNIGQYLPTNAESLLYEYQNLEFTMSTFVNEDIYMRASATVMQNEIPVRVYFTWGRQQYSHIASSKPINVFSALEYKKLLRVLFSDLEDFQSEEKLQIAREASLVFLPLLLPPSAALHAEGRKKAFTSVTDMRAFPCWMAFQPSSAYQALLARHQYLSHYQRECKDLHKKFEESLSIVERKGCAVCSRELTTQRTICTPCETVVQRAMKTFREQNNFHPLQCDVIATLASYASLMTQAKSDASFRLYMRNRGFNLSPHEQMKTLFFYLLFISKDGGCKREGKCPSNAFQGFNGADYCTKCRQISVLWHCYTTGSLARNSGRPRKKQPRSLSPIKSPQSYPQDPPAPSFKLEPYQPPVGSLAPVPMGDLPQIDQALFNFNDITNPDDFLSLEGDLPTMSFNSMERVLQQQSLFGGPPPLFATMAQTQPFDPSQPFDGWEVLPSVPNNNNLM